MDLALGAAVMTATPLSALYWQCTRKQGYSTKAAAKAAQRHAEKTHGLKMHRYRCRFCDHWHLAKRKPI